MPTKKKTPKKAAKKQAPECEPRNYSMPECDLNEKHRISITGNTFTSSPMFDAKAITGLNDVAKALLNLTELYRANNLTVNMLTVKQP